MVVFSGWKFHFIHSSMPQHWNPLWQGGSNRRDAVFIASVSRSADKPGLYLEAQCVIWNMWFLTNMSLPPIVITEGGALRAPFLWQKYLPCTPSNVLSAVSPLLRDYEGAALMERFIGFRISAPHGSCHGFHSFDFWSGRCKKYFTAVTQVIQKCRMWMFAYLLNALMISGRSLLVIPVSLILYLQMHDVHIIDRWGTSVSASCGNLSIRSISGIQSYFAGNSAKWNDTCRAKSRHCLTFSSYIIAALMRFGQKNPYQSSWLVSGQSKEQEFQLKNIFGCIY